MDLRIKDEVELNIEDVNYEGLGVARYNDKVVFVARAIKGEKVLARIDYVNKNFYKAHAVKIIEGCSDREEKLCKNYPKCGGCQILHIKYDAGLAYKLIATNNTIRKISLIDYEIKEIIGNDKPYPYRNKVQIPVREINGKLVMGYYQEQTHNIIPFDECLLQSDNITNLVNYVKLLCVQAGVTGYNELNKRGCLRHILIRENNKNELMLVFITNEKMNKLDDIITNIINKFPNVISIIQNFNSKDSNVILGDKSKVLYGKDEIIDEVLGLKYKISHKSFFQVNRCQTEKLYSKVLEYVGCNKNVIDAYCGVGSISLQLTKNNKYVYGIEVVEDAVNNAIDNMKLNNINNAEFMCAKVEDKILDLLEEHDIDCVVIDPPRKGIDEKVVEALIKAKIKKLVYVSCNPSSLARDLSRLKEVYEVKDFVLVDMFAFTNGVESVVKLEIK